MSKSSLARSRTRLPLESVTTTSMLVMSSRAHRREAKEQGARENAHSTAGCEDCRDSFVGGAGRRRLQQDQSAAGGQAGQRVLQGGSVSGGARGLPGSRTRGSVQQEARQE